MPKVSDNHASSGRHLLVRTLAIQQNPSVGLDSKLRECYDSLRRTNPTGVPGSLRKYAMSIAPKLGYSWQDVLRQIEEDGVLVERAGSYHAGSKFNVRFA